MKTVKTKQETEKKQAETKPKLLISTDELDSPKLLITRNGPDGNFCTDTEGRFWEMDGEVQEDGENNVRVEVRLCYGDGDEGEDEDRPEMKDAIIDFERSDLEDKADYEECKKHISNETASALYNGRIHYWLDDTTKPTRDDVNHTVGQWVARQVNNYFKLEQYFKSRKTTGDKKQPKDASAKKADASPRPSELLRADAKLVAIVGSEFFQKPFRKIDIIFKVSEYVTKHGLRDKKNKLQINADAALMAICDGEKVISQLKLGGLVSRYIDQVLEGK